MVHMIDPRKVTDFKRTDEQLEEFLLFSIVVAGKGAFQQATKLEEFLSRAHGRTPFGLVRVMDMDGTLIDFLRQCKMGQYNRISTAFRGVAHFFKWNPDSERHSPLRDIPVERLECVKGIGMKTARFFAMHTRPFQQFACLDTHILQWLGEKGHVVPRTTPQGIKYLELEKVFLDYCKQMGKLPADLDLEIWNSRHEQASGKESKSSARANVLEMPAWSLGTQQVGTITSSATA